MVNATVPGSYLALTHPAKDINADVVAEGARRYNQHVKVPQTRWRPDPGADGLEENVSAWGGVARKE